MKILNKRIHGVPEGAVLVDRTTPFGNPYVVGIHGTRDEVIEKYRAWVEINFVLKERIKRELKGKDLVCHCWPLRCHAEAIMEILNN